MSDVIQSTTQQFLDIHDITNNYVIMRNGTVSTILTVDAMNFGLLAEEEQDAIMYAYAGLLNSLNYPIQIIINSQTKDVTSYLRLLQEQEASAENETMAHRIRMYREFVGNLIHERNVLDKKFYVVIPATSLELGIAGAKSVLPGKDTFDINSVERSIIIEKAQNLLDPKRDHLIAQFARIGLFSRQLNTQEIIQLFYIRYNPEAAEGQQIGESKSYTTPLVKASIQGTGMNAPIVAAQPTVTTVSPSSPQVAPLPEIHVAVQPDAEAVPVTEAVTNSPESTVPSLDTPTPAAIQPEISIPPTPAPMQAEPGISAPPVTASPTTIETPPQMGATLVQPSTAMPALSEEQTQAELNATIQSLGSVPPAAGGPDLPPLPEI